MTKTTIMIGLNDKDSKIQEITTIEAFKIVTRIFADCECGVTITEGMGVYKHDDGTIITETTLVCVNFGDELEAIKKACKLIKVALNQEAVAIEVTESNSVFF